MLFRLTFHIKLVSLKNIDYCPNLWDKIYHIWCVCPNMGIQYFANFDEIDIHVFRRLVATSRAHQIMALSMLRSFGKIGPQIDQIWAWLSRGHRWSPRVRNPLKSLVTGPSLLVNCYIEIKFNKIIKGDPPPPPPPLT